MKTVSLSLISSFLLATTTFGATLSKDLLESSLVVYHGAVALVHEKRHLHVNSEDQQIVYEGVANTIETDSVNVLLPSGITLNSQQFRYDKLTRSKLLEAHIGKEVQAKILQHPDTYETLKVTLLSHEGDTCMVTTPQRKIMSVPSAQILFSSIPDELITKPSLVWNIRTDQTHDATMSLDYLIGNISWKSDYILNLGNNDANLSGWITIDNRSGKAFKQTRLHVLAGNINRITQTQPRYKAAMLNRTTAETAVTHVAHEGYHFYSIPFTVTLANNEKTQIKFMDLQNLHVSRRYDVTLSNPSYFHGEQEHSVNQYVHIDGLNVPLPKGVVRTYAASSRQHILLGESSMPPLAKQQPVDLRLGDNFDVKVKETTLQRDDDKRYFQATLRYSITNSSDHNKTIELLVPFQNQKKNSIDTTMPYSIKQGNLVSFTLNVAANNTQKFDVSFRGKR
ncbi:MAG: hypothetical protein DSZ03_08385 [Sulfurimonas sp.]|nr:MAG: hypothetical protein DSZ03_08385 [Sulfurimonas sp.]